MMRLKRLLSTYTTHTYGKCAYTTHTQTHTYGKCAYTTHIHMVDMHTPHNTQTLIHMVDVHTQTHTYGRCAYTSHIHMVNMHMSHGTQTHPYMYGRCAYTTHVHKHSTTEGFSAASWGL